MNDYEELCRLLDTYRTDAWRLEALDHYKVPGEEATLAAFLRGDPEPPPDPELGEWLEILRALPAQGRTTGRVHAIVGSLTPYLRYELEWGYAPCAAAGEDIRILHRPSWQETPFGRQPPDFWLVDDSVVAVMHYDPDGRWLGLDLTTEAGDVAEYRSLRDMALRDAVPLAEYLAAMRVTPLDPSALLRRPVQRIA